MTIPVVTYIRPQQPVMSDPDREAASAKCKCCDAQVDAESGLWCLRCGTAMHARSEAMSSGWTIRCARVVYMRVCYLTCTLGTCTYNAVLAWLVKKAEDNQVELRFFFSCRRPGLPVFERIKTGKPHDGDIHYIPVPVPAMPTSRAIHLPQ